MLKNDDMALTTAQLNLFLKIAHASGKLIHFDDKDLREYVIVDPAYLIEVLRSIVTEKLFWPKSETLREIFEPYRKSIKAVRRQKNLGLPATKTRWRD
jgi:hypothetical protein